MHGRQHPGLQRGELAHRWARGRPKTGVMKQTFRNDRLFDNVALGNRWAVSNACKQVTAQQGAGRFLEHDTGIPTVRHVRRINIAKALATDIDNLAVGKQARLAISHVAYRNATAQHSVSKLSCGRSGQPFVHRSAFIDLSFHDTLPTAALVCDRLLRDYEAFRVLKSCGDEECTFSAGSRWLMAASRQYLI